MEKGKGLTGGSTKLSLRLLYGVRDTYTPNINIILGLSMTLRRAD